ncbi:MAG: hypothetical protein CME61_03310 [Halobacteriovoraceae bacterium]|nr:hypothetical protein [Halobacteriovoraceae bacterium]|tara:strand:- start:217 stop:993 length:777 start_codon:yes stop_codon:yes gene_type:complete
MSLAISNELVFYAFWIAFCRWFAIIINLPIFDHAAVPRTVKILFCLCLNYAFFPFVEKTIVADITQVGVDNVWILVIYYSVVGIAIGFLAKTIFQIFNSAGSIITQQVGFSAIRYFDLSVTDQVGPFERMISFVMLAMIITSGGLLPLMKGSFLSFESMSFMKLSGLSEWTVIFTEVFKSVFSLAIVLSIPLIFSNVLVMIVLGIISRMIPQMNVLMVSFVLNIGVGLVVFLFNSEEFFNVGLGFYSELLGKWFQFVS